MSLDDQKCFLRSTGIVVWWAELPAFALLIIDVLPTEVEREVFYVHGGMSSC